MTIDLTALRSRQIRLAYEYWQRCRGDRPMPARRDLDPLDMGPWLAQTMLVDVSSEPLDFRFRLVGTAIVNRIGREITGKRVRELELEGRQEQIFEEYRQTVLRKQPRYLVDEHELANGRTIYFERLLMPLSENGEDVNMLFGVQFCSADGRGDPGFRAI